MRNTLSNRVYVLAFRLGGNRLCSFIARLHNRGNPSYWVWRLRQWWHYRQNPEVK